VILPSIDVMDGRAVQLIGGREKALDAGDPFPIADAFGVVGELAVVDLDAALSCGSNREIIRELCRRVPCRVGGGIRTYESAVEWLDAGASKLVLGTAAEPELLRRLPKDRVIAALDAREGIVVVDGWRHDTGERVLDRMSRLRGLVGGYLVTFVEREGRQAGTRLDVAREVVRAAGDASVTIAGGVTTPADVAALDAIGADAQVGMALYTGRLDLGDAVAACARSDRPDGLIPTVVVDEYGGALGLSYSSAQTLAEAVRTRRGIYCSRKRGRWVKGETSGATQQLLQVSLDCDRDALRFKVRQSGAGFCHQGTSSCWGMIGGLAGLECRLSASGGSNGSYTARVRHDAALLRAKLIEESGELADARTHREVTHEAADVVYFTSIALLRSGVGWPAVLAELDRRALRSTRRGGEAKPGVIA